MWYGDVALKVAFPILYDLACVKDASIAANLEIMGGTNQWNMSFAKVSHDWEVDFLLLSSKCCIHLL
jgi:hypothetical protein